MHEHTHSHGHQHEQGFRGTAALVFALAANTFFLVVEVVGGIAFGSLALLADAAHLVSDVVALTIALIALMVVGRPATERHTYGFGRAEVLAAQANGALLLVGALAVAVEAARRFAHPHHLEPGPVLVVGLVGLLVNASSAYVLSRRAGHDMNLRAAMWHLAFDALGSFAVIIAAIGALAAGADWLDPVASLVIAVLVALGGWQLLRGTTRVLLEAAPAGLDVAGVRAALAAEPDVEAVHHLHVWSLASQTPALSAHVVLRGETWTLHDAQQRGDALKAMLATRFGIEHATLEIECHACDNADEHA